MAEIVPSATAVLDRPRSSRVTPAELYLASLSTWQSRKAARYSLSRIARILRKPDWQTLPWERLTATETTYVHAMVVKNFAPATARLTVSVLRGVLHQAYRLKLMDTEAYHRAIDLNRIAGRSPAKGRALSEAEIKKLTGYIASLKAPRGPMVEALFAAGLGGGLRREELATLKANALSADGEFLSVMGKGGRARLQKLPPWARDAIRRWLAVREAHEFETDRLFVQGAGPHLRDAPMTVGDVWYLVTETGERAGIAHFSPHDLRRTFATRMLEMVDLSQTQKLMAHQDISTTVRYDKREATEANKAVDRLPSWGFGEKEKKSVKPLTATVEEIVTQKNGATSRAGGAAPMPVAPEERVAPVFEKASVEVEGQRLVNRRIVKKPEYLRNGVPADLAWLRSQIGKLAEMGVPSHKIVGALTKTGVRRGDGSELGVADVERWATG